MEYEVVCVLHCNHGYDRLIYAEYSCGQDGNWTIPVDINSPGTTPCLGRYDLCGKESIYRNSYHIKIAKADSTLKYSMVIQQTKVLFNTKIKVYVVCYIYT